MNSESCFSENDRALGCFDLPLEELHPADPGELSGVALGMVEDGGEDACLGVYVGNHHEIGHLLQPALRMFLSEAVARVKGRDNGDFDTAEDLEEGFEPGVHNGALEEGFHPGVHNGAELRCTGSGETTELSVYFGSVHCFGVARGPALRAFVLKALDRAAPEEAWTRRG